MATGLRIKINPAGLRAVLQSPEMQAILKAQTDAIAEEAGDGFEARVQVAEGSSKLGRAMGYVTTATPQARKRQAEDPVLQRATNARRRA